jgi:hypothetical protein
MTGGLMNIISYGANDLYLTGSPQITFFKVMYRRYTNFAIESMEFVINDLGFNNLSHIEIPKTGDLIREMYLQIDIPSVSFLKSDIGLENENIIKQTKYETNYNTVLNFMNLNVGAYRIANEGKLAENTIPIAMVGNIMNMVEQYPNYELLISSYESLIEEYYNATANPIFISSFSNIYEIASSIKIDLEKSISYTKDQIMCIINNALNTSQKVQVYFYDEMYNYNNTYKEQTSDNLKFAWVEKLGHAILEYIDIYIGGQKIDRHFGEWIDIWYELTKSKFQEQMYYKMIGNVSSMTSYNRNAKPSYTLKIPLRFWFCKIPGLAFPIIALQFDSFNIDIKLRTIEDCSYIEHNPLVDTAVSITDLWEDKGYSLKGKLLIDYVFLDMTERRRMAMSAHEYLIERIQDMVIYDINDEKQSITLDFNNPCKSFVWITQKQAYTNNSTGWYKSFWCQYGLHMINGSNATTFDDPTLSSSFELNGHDRFTTFEGRFYNYAQTEHNTSTPPDGVNVMNIALYPEEHQPSSSCNLSKIASPVLNLFIDKDMFTYTMADIDPNIIVGSDDDVMKSTSVKIMIFAISYNVLRIIGGLGALAYT